MISIFIETNLECNKQRKVFDVEKKETLHCFDDTLQDYNALERKHDDYEGLEKAKTYISIYCVHAAKEIDEIC